MFARNAGRGDIKLTGNCRPLLPHFHYRLSNRIHYYFEQKYNIFYYLQVTGLIMDELVPRVLLDLRDPVILH